VSDGRRGLARSSSAIAVFAGAGVLSGFLVDATMAAIFGAGARTDAFFIAATIPFAVASLLLASTTQVLVPLVNGWFRSGDRDDALRRVGNLLGSGLAVGAVVAAAGVLLARVIPLVIAPGAAPDTKRAAATMTALLFVTVITRIGAEILRATLNARFSFVGPAAMPLVENGTVFAVMLALHQDFGVRSVAIGYVVGGVAQFAFMAVIAAARGVLPRPHVRLRDPEMRTVGRLVVLPLSGTGLTMLSRVAERFLASFLPAGSITILNYGWVVVNSLGGTVFFRSVVVALLPRLSEARDDERATRRIMGDGVFLMLLISIPLLVAAVVLAQPLVALAFQRGAFTASQAAMLAGVIAIYSLQFPFDAVNRVYVSYWYARLDTVVPFWNVAIGVALDIVFAIALVYPWGIYGIAFAYVLSSVGYLIHGAWSVHRRLAMPTRELIVSATKITIASAASGAAMWFVLHALPTGRDLATRVRDLAVPAVVGAAVLIVGLAVLRVRIWGVLLGGLGRRRNGTPRDRDDPGAKPPTRPSD
jgi:putative peptidoglycan lipid II flippase